MQRRDDDTQLRRLNLQDLSLDEIGDLEEFEVDSSRDEGISVNILDSVIEQITNAEPMVEELRRRIQEMSVNIDSENGGVEGDNRSGDRYNDEFAENREDTMAEQGFLDGENKAGLGEVERKKANKEAQLEMAMNGFKHEFSWDRFIPLPPRPDRRTVDMSKLGSLIGRKRDDDK